MSLISFLLASLMSVYAADNEGLKIATKAYNMTRGWGDYVVNLQMDIQLANGSTTSKFLRIKNLEGDQGDKSLVVFDRPADVKGTALLTHAHLDQANDQWLYLPEMRRTKRITSDSRNKSFMGSEFTYDDMTFNDLTKYTYQFVKKEKCALGECSVVEQTPKDKESSYSKLMVWYDNEGYRAIKTEYYDSNKALFKRLERSDYKKYLGKVWFASTMVMHNVQTNKSTTLKFSDFKFANHLSEKDFSATQLNNVK